MIRCVIIDDEQPAINVLKKYIDRLPNLELIGEATNPIEGIEIVKNEKPHVVFLDIQMDEMMGIEVMKILPEHTLVVFCTAYSEFAITSYEMWAVDYLMKPIEFPRFVKAVQRVGKALSMYPTSPEDAINNDYIFVKLGEKGKMFKIDLDDIDFVEGLNNYVTFHCGDKKMIAYLRLKELEERLPDSQFMRVQKSYIVALKEIASMQNNELVLKKGPTRIPIGPNYRDAFMERMRSKLMS